MDQKFGAMKNMIVIYFENKQTNKQTKYTKKNR